MKRLLLAFLAFAIFALGAFAETEGLSADKALADSMLYSADQRTKKYAGVKIEDVDVQIKSGNKVAEIKCLYSYGISVESSIKMLELYSEDLSAILSRDYARDGLNSLKIKWMVPYHFEDEFAGVYTYDVRGGKAYFKTKTGLYYGESQSSPIAAYINLLAENGITLNLKDRREYTSNGAGGYKKEYYIVGDLFEISLYTWNGNEERYSLLLETPSDYKYQEKAVRLLPVSVLGASEDEADALYKELIEKEEVYRDGYEMTLDKYTNYSVFVIRWGQEIEKLR